MDPNLTGRGEENLGMGFPDRPSIGTFSPAKTRDFLTGGDRLSRKSGFEVFIRGESFLLGK
jgi:hypothetical protein